MFTQRRARISPQQTPLSDESNVASNNDNFSERVIDTDSSQNNKTRKNRKNIFTRRRARISPEQTPLSDTEQELSQENQLPVRDSELPQQTESTEQEAYETNTSSGTSTDPATSTQTSSGISTDPATPTQTSSGTSTDPATSTQTSTASQINSQPDTQENMQTNNFNYDSKELII